LSQTEEEGKRNAPGIGWNTTLKKKKPTTGKETKQNETKLTKANKTHMHREYNPGKGKGARGERERDRKEKKGLQMIILRGNTRAPCLFCNDPALPGSVITVPTR
jgi:hypothetical protein